MMLAHPAIDRSRPLFRGGRVRPLRIHRPARFASGGAGFEVEIQALNEWLPSTIVAAGGSGRVTARDRWAEAVETAKAFIEENLGERLDVVRIAREVHFSPPQLTRIFRELEGVSPWEYVIERRVRRAAELIEADRPLSEVALDTGFADQSHLTRAFKRVTGKTPGEFRRDDPNVQDGGDRAA